MIIYKRLIIVLFALIFLGAFSNFAQNNWGTHLIIWSEAFIFVCYLIQAIVCLFKRNFGLAYESFFLSTLFLGAVFKNNWWPGAAMLLIFSVGLLLPFYIFQIIKFYRQNITKGTLLISLLTLGSATTLIFGVSILFKIQHWPYATILFYLGMFFTIIMIIGSFKWKYEFNGETINLWRGLGLIKNNLIILYFLTFTISAYSFLASIDLAPKFYSQNLPRVIEMERNKKGVESKRNAEEMIDAYQSFIDNCEKNGFLE